MKIGEFSSEEHALLDEYCERAVQCHKNTSPADRERAESAISKIYLSGGPQKTKTYDPDKEPPSPLRFHWFDSPYQLSNEIDCGAGNLIGDRNWRTDWLINTSAIKEMQWAIDRDMDDAFSRHLQRTLREHGPSYQSLVEERMGLHLRDKFRTTFSDARRDEIWGEMQFHLRSDMWFDLRNSIDRSFSGEQWLAVADELGDLNFQCMMSEFELMMYFADGWDQLQSKVWDDLWAEIQQSLKERFWDALLNKTKGELQNFASGWFGMMQAGQCDYSQLLYFQLAAELGVKLKPSHLEDLQNFLTIGESTGLWFALENACFCCEWPEILRYDADNELHCTDGPAVVFRDGWQLWSIDGVMVDEQIVMRPESQSLIQISSEENTEVKRIRIERFGWDRYLQQSGAVVIDSRFNHIEQTEEALLQLAGMKVLICACPSTARIYQLEVEPSITTCESAQNWLRGDLEGTQIIGSS